MTLWFWLMGPTATGLLLWGVWKMARLFYLTLMYEYWVEMTRRALERETGRPHTREQAMLVPSAFAKRA